MRNNQETRQRINLDEKILSAATQEEREAWESNRGMLEKHNMDFCAGWHVGIYKHVCGHWEILQSPIYNNYGGEKPYTAEDADRELREISSKSKCTRCVCGR